jgi:hypothetical protein
MQFHDLFDHIADRPLDSFVSPTKFQRPRNLMVPSNNSPVLVSLVALAFFMSITGSTSPNGVEPSLLPYQLFDCLCAILYYCHVCFTPPPKPQQQVLMPPIVLCYRLSRPLLLLVLALLAAMWIHVMKVASNNIPTMAFFIVVDLALIVITDPGAVGAGCCQITKQMPELKITPTLILKGRDKMIALAAGNTPLCTDTVELSLTNTMHTCEIVSAVVVLFFGGGTLFATLGVW